jgi:Raf kinase inhibitor-like YbhB/YbcL family protein
MIEMRRRTNRFHRPRPCAALLAAAALLALGLGGCAGGTPGPADNEGGATVAFKITSTAFKDGERMPVRHTGEGADVSPPLAWDEPPAGTKTFALICDDPDAPRGTWDHWVIWNLPGAARSLPENVSRNERPGLDGAVQGKNSWPRVGYNGPMPPPGHGTHHYHFVLYALDASLDLPAGATKKELLAAMKGHILGEAKITALYSR